MDKSEAYLALITALTALLWTIKQAIENKYCHQARKKIQERVRRLEQKDDNQRTEEDQDNGEN